jgi:hypothetical protein
MRLLYAALAVLLLSFAPLAIVGTFDPAANPIGLGLLFVAGSLVAALLFALAVLQLLWRLWRLLR